MWNFYVISILCLYAPSHKYRNRDPITDTDDLLLNNKDASESVVVQYYTNDTISGDTKIDGVTFKNKSQRNPSASKTNMSQVNFFLIIIIYLNMIRTKV